MTVMEAATEATTEVGTWAIVATIALLVMVGVVLVIAAFFDRTRAREIQRDLAAMASTPRHRARPSRNHST